MTYPFQEFNGPEEVVEVAEKQIIGGYSTASDAGSALHMIRALAKIVAERTATPKPPMNVSYPIRPLPTATDALERDLSDLETSKFICGINFNEIRHLIYELNWYRENWSKRP